MKLVRFTEAAADDLEEIYKFIAEDNLPAADRMIMQLQKRWRLLAQTPGSGRKREEFQLDLRSSTEGNYIIFYQVIPDGIELIRILHARRDIEKIFRS